MGCSPSNSKTATKQTTQPIVPVKKVKKSNNDQSLKSIAFEIPADDLKSKPRHPVLPSNDGGSRWKVCGGSSLETIETNCRKISLSRGSAAKMQRLIIA
jgi:hypothetical protein